MRRYLALAGFSLALVMAAPAQESDGARVVVPARDGRPRVVKASTLNGPITVKTHAGTDVIVEAGPDVSPRARRERAPAPHRSPSRFPTVGRGSPGTVH